MSHDCFVLLYVEMAVLQESFSISRCDFGENFFGIVRCEQNKVLCQFNFRRRYNVKFCHYEIIKTFIVSVDYCIEFQEKFALYDCF